MNPQDRKTLRNYFRAGALPTAQHYSDLIDSVVTWKDDGFDKSPAEGWRIAAVGEHRALMSFYRGVGEPEPEWLLAHGREAGALHLRGADAAETAESDLAVTREGGVGLGCDRPSWRLDVNGVARMHGRIGAARPGTRATVPADGGWHDITEPLEGCHALEIVAGAGGAVGEGRYAMIHAIALNAYNPRNPLLNWLLRRRSIRAQTAVFGGFSDRLRLRWRTATPGDDAETGVKGAAKGGERRYNRPYTLQLRTQASYGGGYRIRYYVTRLWFDSRMEGSRRPDVDRDDGLL
jgi:hypothetical protein